MAKKKSEVPATVEAEVPAAAQTTAVARAVQPIAGMENFTQDDLVIPRINIAQGLSQIVADSVAKMGDIYNSLTFDVISESKDRQASIEIIPVFFGKSRVLYSPRKEAEIDSLVERLDIEIDDAGRNQWRNRSNLICRSTDSIHAQGDFGAGSEYNPTGFCQMFERGVLKHECPLSVWQGDNPPLCNFFRNVFVLVRGYDFDIPLAVSFGRTSSGAGKLLVNLMNTMGRKTGAIWGYAYKLSTVYVESDGHKYYKWKASVSTPANEDEQAMANAFYEMVKTSQVIIHEETENPDADADGDSPY